MSELLWKTNDLCKLEKHERYYIMEELQLNIYHKLVKEKKERIVVEQVKEKRHLGLLGM